MLVTRRHAYAIGDIGECLEIRGLVRTVDKLSVSVVVDIILVTDFGDRGAFGEGFGERLRSGGVRAFGILGKGNLYIAVGTSVVLDHHYIILRSTLHKCGVNTAETRLIKQLWITERSEILSCHIIETMIVLLLLYADIESGIRHT
jgi:hypothetical protein